jgi:N-acetylglucosaminyldiphosphoundecaprenol N-acetyl-beta-D-mannosaminyltransferase
VSSLRRDELLDEVARALDDRQPLRITFLNPDYARRALLSPALLDDINGFDVVAVDGNGVRLVTGLFGFTVPERLDTDSLAPDLFRLASERRQAVFLFGCAPDVAREAGTRVAAHYPGLRIVGTDHGYHDVQRGHPGHYAAADSEAIVARINASGADLVIVSLPTPLQQRWVAEYGDRLRAPVVVTGGSYLDHVAEGEGLDGDWYPRWADTLRLNWLYRLAQEPRRLWRRYTVESLHFLLLVLRARLRTDR